MRNFKGITLLALVITIIVLLILAGISVLIINKIIIDKTVEASDQTASSSVEEQVNMAWMDCEAEYISAKNEDMNISKDEFFKENLPSKLMAANRNISDVLVTGSTDDNLYVKMKYKKQEDTFLISKDGDIALIYDLKGNVKLGDFVEYNVSYTDTYSGGTYTAQNGWRVIDDGVMTGTSGRVRLVSTGVPVRWWYANDETSKSEAASKLMNDFENVTLYLQNDYESYILGSAFKVKYADKVTALTLSNVNYAYNKLYNENSRASSDITNLEQYNNLFSFQDVFCWLVSSSNLYSIKNKTIKEVNTNMMYGIRPVIVLEEDLIGIKASNVWKIVD